MQFKFYRQQKRRLPPSKAEFTAGKTAAWWRVGMRRNNFAGLKRKTGEMFAILIILMYLCALKLKYKHKDA